MTRDEFWHYVEAARTKDAKEPEKGLRAVLAPLSPAELAAFENHFGEVCGASYQWNLWGAAYLIEGGCSDDGFDYFRYGLISHGRTIYEAALKNPDSLEEVDDDFTNETYSYVARKLYREKTGKDLIGGTSIPLHPAGEEWDFDDPAEMKRRFPMLYKKYGN